MAAPERFAEKSDLLLQRGHRPYMARCGSGVCIAASRDVVFAESGGNPRVARPRLNSPPVGHSETLPSAVGYVIPAPHYDSTPKNKRVGWLLPNRMSDVFYLT